MPLRAAKIEHRIRETRDGKLYDSRFGHRHQGQGTYWNTVEQTWQVWTRRLGFDRPEEDEAPQRQTFRRPAEVEPQLEFTF